MSAQIYRLEVYPKTFSPKGLIGQDQLRWHEVRGYHLKCGDHLDTNKLNEVFVDPVLHQMATDVQERPSLLLDGSDPQFIVEVSSRPGVTDNPGKSASEALVLVGINAQVATHTLFFFYGPWQREAVSVLATKELGNPLIQDIVISTFSEFQAHNPFREPSFPNVSLGNESELIEVFDLTSSDEQWMKMSEERCWALSLEEVRFLKTAFSSSELMKKRRERGLSEQMTDVEVEIIAQSWSEHCKHKIFAAEIDYQEAPDAPQPLGSKKISGLYPSYIKKTTKEMPHSWLISVFSDNAGIVRFDSKLDACIKVETHNSPSALDPYGGALTGILGVNRDIMGTGLGARPVANMDVFCFGPPHWPAPGLESFMPQGLMEPRHILSGVHKGVEDGGNKSGIPTVNGAIHFDQDYSGKPLVFVGTIGLMPQRLPSGIETDKKRTRVGDKIVVIGGAIGADGIHGATFSSMELKEDAPATAVQIGDPLTQKRVMDLLLEARDLELYSGLTDNGAGGLSSSLGEMATLTNGARFDLALNPTKYPGLRPFELMISESQERMSLSVASENVEAFLSLCRRRNVDAHVLGEFTDNGLLEVYYKERCVALLDLEFLHEGLPKMKLEAYWSGPRARTPWMPISKEELPSTFNETLLKLLKSPNIASKEKLVRQYDHEVQGATVMKPFSGIEGRAPSDAGGIWLKPHGGDEEGVLFVANGLAPRMSLIDPFLMAQMAVDEAVRALVTSGADPGQICLLDNFCWPDPVASPKNPDGQRKLAELVRTCEGLAQTCKAYQAPLVSGKDSMKNDFRGRNLKGDPLVISILPTLLVTGMGRGELSTLVTTPFKKAGDLVYVLGRPCQELLGSELDHLFDLTTMGPSLKAPSFDAQENMKLYRQYFELAKRGLLQSGHDLSDGGALVAVAESLIGAPQGLGVSLYERSLEELTHWAFSEGAGRILISVDPSDQSLVEEVLADCAFELIGEVDQSARLSMKNCSHLDLTVTELAEAFCGEEFR